MTCGVCHEPFTKDAPAIVLHRAVIVNENTVQQGDLILVICSDCYEALKLAHEQANGEPWDNWYEKAEKRV